MKHRAQKLIPAHRGTLGWMWLGVILAAFDASALGQDATGPGEERPVARLSTPWTDQVDQRNPHPEYPRPQMERLTDTRGEVSWNHLNGLWDYQITDREASEPSSWEGQILVPFPIESQLSGVQRWVSPQQALWYHRSFASPPLRERERLLLHLGACDWETSVWVDGKLVGSHRGGYDPFTLDITESLQDKREHRLVIRVWDPTDSASQPRGKQVRRPEGIWYTAVTGIWQTVWLERVPESRIGRLKIVPDAATKSFQLSVTCEGTRLEQPQVRLRVEGLRLRDQRHDLSSGPIAIEGTPDQPLRLAIPEAKLWTPEEPWLYELSVELWDRSKRLDRIGSYVGIRSITMGRDADGKPRMLLNGTPLFQYGPLDQGWWPDGLYTAPTDEALQFDIDVTKRLGFNMARKHVKVEPSRWYAHCDRQGLLVWQDFPSGFRTGSQEAIGDGAPDPAWSDEQHQQFMTELEAMINHLHNHPSIVVWVPFNEGWGQHQTNDVLAQTKKWDPTRLIDGPSGWTDRGEGDLWDMHRYPGPDMFPVTPDRVSVLGEFGGLGLPLEGHTWLDKNNWGYRTFNDRSSLQEGYEQLVMQLPSLIGRGLAAAVYTQTTDVEIEVNGLMTYDRRQIKYDQERLAKLHQRLYEPPPREWILFPASGPGTSDSAAQRWRYTLEKPHEGWEKAEFHDESWSEGPAGFGSLDPPGSRVRTTWSTPDIWLRKKMRLEPQKRQGTLALWIHHDEDTEVYVNGTKIVELKGYTVAYKLVPLTPAQETAFREGDNQIALHCHQTGGGQYVDMGIVELIPTTDR